MRKFSVLILAVWFLAAAAHAATFDKVTDADILGRADLVVVATVIDSTVRVTDDRNIYTDTRLQVEDVLKGEAGQIITVTQLGGFANGRGIVVPGAAKYEDGTRVVAFLRSYGDRWVTANMSLGKLRFVQRDGQDLVVRDDEVEGVDAELFAPRPARAFVDAIRNGHIGRMPRIKIEATASRPEVPAPNAPAESYVFVDGSPAHPIRWKDCETVGCDPITFTKNTNQNGSNNTDTAVANAMDAWNSDPNSFVNFAGIAGSNSQSKEDNDDINDLVFNGVIENAHCDGTIGCGIVYFGNTHIFDGTTFYNMVSADVVLNTEARSQTALETILTHEFGHALAFRHSNQGSPSSSDSIMTQSISLSRGATLGSWDLEALAEVYGAGLPCTPADLTSSTPSHNIPYGTSDTLSATATGTNVKFDWYEGTSGNTANRVGGAASYKTPPITTATSFWVKASNDCGSENGPTITLTPNACIPVQIAGQPQNIMVNMNSSTTLSVAANGSPEIHYQWFQGGAGDTSTPVGTDKNSYKTPNLTTATSYWVRTFNDCGEADSNVATVTVQGGTCTSPSITGQPSGSTVQLGGSATMTVAAGGTAPLTFQWYEGLSGDTSKPVAGATSATLTVGPILTVGTTSYWVQVRNACSTAFVNSATVTITVGCTNPSASTIFAPGSAPRANGYDVSWTGNFALSPTFELQEATDAAFTQNVHSFTVPSLSGHISAHAEVTVDTRFYYRVRPISICDGQPGPWSNTTSTVVTIPPPATSREFTVAVPYGTTEPYQQPLFVEGFGASATPGDSYAVSTDVTWLTVSPSSGPLPAAGVTVTLTATLAELPAGSAGATITVTRTQGNAGRFGTNGTTSAALPFSMSLVTPITPAPRDLEAPPGTLIIPAVAHADGVNTRFQSDIRIANVSFQDIEYDITFTPSGQNGLESGKKTTLTINAGESASFDDIVKTWYGAGVADEYGGGTLEIRPLNSTDPHATAASSRLYAIESRPDALEGIPCDVLRCTLGQFIPAVPLDQFIGPILDNPQAKISLQQIANSTAYRTNLGFVEGSGQTTNVLAKLLDGNNTLLASATFSIPPFGHQQNALAHYFPSLGALSDGRVEVEVQGGGKVTSYASVLDNQTNDPLLVFPTQASSISANHYVVPGIADVVGNSVFASDMRIFNGGETEQQLTLNYYPQTGEQTQRPEAVEMTVAPGQVLAIDDVLPTLWDITQTGGAVGIDAGEGSSLVVTARTYSPLPDGGTNGQFIPGVTSSEAIGLGERNLNILQLEQSPQFRTNFGIFEVTGQPVKVEVTAYKPDSKVTAAIAVDLPANGFSQFGRIFEAMGFPSVYSGRISVKVLEGEGRVSAYGSVVDMKTSDPTYVPAQ